MPTTPIWLATSGLPISRSTMPSKKKDARDWGVEEYRVVAQALAELAEITSIVDGSGSRPTEVGDRLWQFYWDAKRAAETLEYGEPDPEIMVAFREVLDEMGIPHYDGDSNE